MQTEFLSLPVNGPRIDTVQAVLQHPKGRSAPQAVLLAHGAGAPMESEFMTCMAQGLVERGYPVLRFRYAYMERAAREQRRFPPDRAPQLEAVQRVALHWLRERFPAHVIVMAGKSMGGRMSSHLAAAGEACAGLIFLGYPLHPAKQPLKLRSQHFSNITQPSLFLQGTRDALCRLDLLGEALASYGAPYELVLLDGGDHSFDVLKRSGRTTDEVRLEILEAMERWMQALAKGSRAPNTQGTPRMG